jgi:hypothetical protein
MRRVLCAAVLALTIAACGSTVPLSSQSSSLAAGDGLSLGQPSATTAPSTGQLPGTSSSNGSVPTRGGVPSASAIAAPGSTATQGVVRGSSAPVEIGLFVVKDLGPVTKSLGVDGLATGNGTVQGKAAVGLLNTRGGLAGHRVNPVIFEYDATGNQNTQTQAACSTFFQDHHVRAVISEVLLQLLQQCVAKAGVPFLSSGNRTTSQAEWARYPLNASGAQLSLERMVPLWVESLVAQKYFAGSKAIGLVYNEDPDYRTAPALLRKALQQHGLSLTAEQSMPGTDDTSKLTAATNAGRSAALRFASQGVDRVMAIDKSGQALTYFGLAASTQGYYPRFGLTSLELPSLLRTVLSARQLEGAAGIGWSPGVDLPVRNQPVVSGLFSTCLAVMRKAGEDMDSGGTRFSALSLCDGAMVLAGAWTDPALQPSTFLPGLRALGAKQPPVLTLSLDFSRYNQGAVGYRPLAFNSAADTFTYTGPMRKAP